MVTLTSLMRMQMTVLASASPVVLLSSSSVSASLLQKACGQLLLKFLMTMMTLRKMLSSKQ